jgi:hypothetical protein
MDIVLECITEDFEPVIVVNPKPRQVAGAIRLLSYRRRTSLSLEMPHGTFILFATNKEDRVHLVWANTTNPNLPGGALLDMSQNETDTLDIRMDNGQVDEISKRSSVLRQTAITVVLHLLRHNAFPDGLIWSSSFYDF